MSASEPDEATGEATGERALALVPGLLEERQAQARAWPLERKPRSGDLLEIAILGFDARGRAFGRVGSFVGVIAGRALPGERLRARVLRRRKQRLELAVEERLVESPLGVPARCRHAAHCGGCSFQELAYPEQLAHKHRRIAEALAAAGLEAEVDAPIGCDVPFGYRNKMDFTFANRRWVEPGEPADAERDFALGLHVRGVWGKVLDVARCEIQFEAGNAILASLRELAKEARLEPWDARAHTGLLRHALLRQAATTGEILVDLVTSRSALDAVLPLAARLRALHPEITTVVQNVTARAASVAVGEFERVLFGPGFVRERLGGLEFRISANSFFQTNTRQAARLQKLVREAARAGPADVVWDLYCGGGFFALSLAADAREVWGFEWVGEAVRDARRNALVNGIANARFVAGDLAQLCDAPEAGAWPAPDVVIVDPPRAGLHPRVALEIERRAPARIVWVACNLATALGDVAHLVQSGYRPSAIQPVDLFPHTPHVECVLTLERAWGVAGP